MRLRMLIWTIAATLAMTRAMAFTGCGGDQNVVTDFIFHEGSGATAYNTGTSGDAGNATLTNGVTFSSDIPVVNTNCGYSVSLLPTGSGTTTPAVETAGNHDPLAGATQFVIMGWIKRESASTASNQSARIVSDESSTTLSANSGFAFRFSGAAGSLALRINTNEVSTSVGGIAPNEGAWHHVAVVYDGTRPGTNTLTRHVHFYVDGIQRGDGSAVPGVIVGANTNKLTVGNSSVSRGVANLMVGKLDDVRILRDLAWDAVGNGKTSAIVQCYMNSSDDYVPLIAPPPDITTNAVNCYGPPLELGQPVLDSVCGVVSVTNDAPAVYPTGVTFVRWTMVDGRGKTNACVQRVTVVDPNPVDSDDDGIPNCWEISHGLNPNDPFDADQMADEQGHSQYQKFIMESIASTASSSSASSSGCTPLPCPTEPSERPVSLDPDVPIVFYFSDLGPTNDYFTASCSSCTGPYDYYDAPGSRAAKTARIFGHAPGSGPVTATLTPNCNAKTCTTPGPDYFGVKRERLSWRWDTMSFSESLSQGVYVAVGATGLRHLSCEPGFKRGGQYQKMKLSWEADPSTSGADIRVWNGNCRCFVPVSNGHTFTSKGDGGFYLEGLQPGIVNIIASSYDGAITAKVTAVKVELEEISFENDHQMYENSTDHGGWGVGSAINDPVWVSGMKNKPASYTKGSTLDMKVNLKITPTLSTPVPAKLLVIGSGGLGTNSVAIVLNGGEVGNVSIATENPVTNVVCKSDVRLDWKLVLDGQTNSIISTPHTIYVLWDEPKGSALATLKRLDWVTAAAHGTASPDAMATAVADGVEAKLTDGFQAGASASFWERLDNPTNSGKGYDCLQQAEVASAAVQMLGLASGAFVVYATGGNPVGDTDASTQEVIYVAPRVDFLRFVTSTSSTAYLNDFEGVFWYASGTGTSIQSVWPRRGPYGDPLNGLKLLHGLRDLFGSGFSQVWSYNDDSCASGRCRDVNMPEVPLPPLP
jgi:hypothetical protein